MSLSAHHPISLVADLNELEFFVLNDPSAQNLFQQYLGSINPNGRRANHILFYADIVSLMERGSITATHSHKSWEAADPLKEELTSVYEKYFLEESAWLLDIKPELLQQVRNSFMAKVALAAFKPAVRAVTRDLVFVHLDSFLYCSIFRNYKETILASSSFVQQDKPKSPKEKESNHKLRRFFGDKHLRDGNAGKRKSLEHQPMHIKEYKLSKIFGERVGIEKTSLLQDGTNDFEEPQSELENLKVLMTRRRDRRLHVFFGDYFEIEDTLFSERIRPQAETIHAFRKQPTHVKSFRLAKFFGERPPTDEFSQSEYDSISFSKSFSSLPRHNKAFHLSKFFGERMDPAKESGSISFASQPTNVKGCTLQKKFGESASHTINFGGQQVSGTWPRSRSKLEKIFGPFNA